ncbi:hypothetical protein C8Q77DRAFT_19294 [Trametes polyzona]|nr:hypothetical protein C8Q77DRAFT_19294 [Trametes polyzona]
MRTTPAVSLDRKRVSSGFQTKAAQRRGRRQDARHRCHDGLVRRRRMRGPRRGCTRFHPPCLGVSHPSRPYRAVPAGNRGPERAGAPFLHLHEPGYQTIRRMMIADAPARRTSRVPGRVPGAFPRCGVGVPPGCRRGNTTHTRAEMVSDAPCHFGADASLNADRLFIDGGLASVDNVR